MGIHRAFRFILRFVSPMLAIFLLVAGCQMSPLPKEALVEHLEKLDDRGLAALTNIEPLKACASFPNGWQPLKLQKAALYSHQQWRSPTRRTAVGITYVRMPLPLSTKTLVWFAMGEVGKRVNDGRIIRQWTDEIGRSWFEAENKQYHMTGYVMTRGFDAWINYCGYRMSEPMEAAEVELGNKSLATILPQSVMAQALRAEQSASAQ